MSPTALVGRFTYNIITSNRNQREFTHKNSHICSLNITSVPDDAEQSEYLLISSHDVAVRWRALLRRPALSTNFSAGWSIFRTQVSFPRYVHMCTAGVDRCLRLVYQSAGLSSCRSIGMNIVFFNMVLPKIRLSHLLPGAVKSLLKSQTFVQIQGRFHFLLKSHAAIQHHTRINYPRH